MNSEASDAVLEDKKAGSGVSPAGMMKTGAAWETTGAGTGVVRAFAEFEAQPDSPSAAIIVRRKAA
jgi:hypothetical protein